MAIKEKLSILSRKMTPSSWIILALLLIIIGLVVFGKYRKQPVTITDQLNQMQEQYRQKWVQDSVNYETSRQKLDSIQDAAEKNRQKGETIINNYRYETSQTIDRINDPRFTKDSLRRILSGY